MVSGYVEDDSLELRVTVEQRFCKMPRWAACCAATMMCGFCEIALAAPAVESVTMTQDEQSCAALTGLNLHALPNPVGKP
jgi:hypothetical protein